MGGTSNFNDTIMTDNSSKLYIFYLLLKTLPPTSANQRGIAVICNGACQKIRTSRASSAEQIQTG